MPACEKCWGDAWLLSQTSGRSQADEYAKLIELRDADPCTPEEQAGQFWDPVLQKDLRIARKEHRIMLLNCLHEIGKKKIQIWIINH